MTNAGAGGAWRIAAVPLPGRQADPVLPIQPGALPTARRVCDSGRKRPSVTEGLVRSRKLVAGFSVSRC